jgi:homocysteine S-methyltransferase
LQKYGDRFGAAEKPIVLGVLLPRAASTLNFCITSWPGSLTDESRKRMKDAGERGVEEGIKLAQELLLQAKDLVAGTYLMPSFGRYEVCGELVKVLRDKMG